jgi:predicted CXXCH cytochrome family protein
MGGCTNCHNSPQGASGERRQIVGAGGDFNKNSHHIHGSITDEDCLVCHDQRYHLDGSTATIPDPQVYLKDPDGGPSIVYDGTPESLETFCLNCHDGDGANGDTTPFSDGKVVPNIKGTTGSLWANSAHNLRGYSQNGNNPITCFGDGTTTGCHSNAHGSDNEKLLSAAAGVTIDQFCYNCHTEGKITNNALSGSGLADDIQQAFSMSEKHNLGTSFSVGGRTYTLQCTTCHNPHIVTGKHWDVESGKSPITRPDLTADPTTNPRAMGTVLWGDEPGEKMDDYAAKGTGSGGWYFNVARGIPYGYDTVPFDQTAVYQPPKKGSGWNFEFDGDVLPDYPTFCLDCHSNTMGSHAPVNWGASYAPHGLRSANKPYYWGDVGMYGNSGNPDPIFNEPGVTRGRGAGHFMRWPYDSVHKNAGINFVLSCTDCHEAHGSPEGSILRTVVNNGTGSTIWNVMCNNCHYYYGGQHEGMSCGNASCHEQNSIHRIKKNGEYSGGTYLWTEPSRPTSTPEITAVIGDIGSNKLRVAFKEGVYTNMDQTGALEPGDFVLTDVGGNNPKTITGVTHTPGSSVATITMSASLTADDIENDTLATRGISVWDVDGDPAGPWPVKISLGSTSFQLNEAAGSTTATDEWGLVAGAVSDSTETFLGDGFFHGDGVNNYIDFENHDTYFKADTALTIEVRIKPSGITTSNYIKRIFARNSNNNYQLSVWRNNNWATYNAPDGVASIAFWVSTVDKHGGKWWKVVLTDYEAYPIVSDHWYKVKVVWNSNKASGIPCDIFVDDQGTDGNGTNENWSGYVNATDADQSQVPDDRKLYTGDRIMTGDGDFAIGCNVNNHSNNVFLGLIDWIDIKLEVDYSGVDSPPTALLSKPSSAFACLTPSGFNNRNSDPKNSGRTDLITFAAGFVISTFLLVGKIKIFV